MKMSKIVVATVAARAERSVWSAFLIAKQNEREQQHTNRKTYLHFEELVLESRFLQLKVDVSSVLAMMTFNIIIILFLMRNFK